jgi:cytochrome c biogenesis protein CcmG/thiol:disulfide interchange protein DsbE
MSAAMFSLGSPPPLPAEAGAAASMAIGQPAPAFTLSDLTGQMTNFSATQGRPILLNFWAAWCAPCREEMPLLQQAYDTHQRAGLTVLAISQDAADRADAARAYWTQAGWTFPSLLDPEGAVARQYQVLLLPSTVFINAEGIVTAVHRGPMNAAQLQQHLATVAPPRGQSKGAARSYDFPIKESG